MRFENGNKATAFFYLQKNAVALFIHSRSLKESTLKFSGLFWYLLILRIGGAVKAVTIIKQEDNEHFCHSVQTFKRAQLRGGTTPYRETYLVMELVLTKQ